MQGFHAMNNHNAEVMRPWSNLAWQPCSCLYTVLYSLGNRSDLCICARHVTITVFFVNACVFMAVGTHGPCCSQLSCR
jgi:hypothetical protein